MPNAVQALVVLATAVLTIWLIDWMKPILVPIALAVLLAFVLKPLVSRMQRYHVPRIAAVVVAVALAFGVLGSVGWLVTRQVTALVDSIPSYERNLIERITALRGSDEGFVERARRVIERISRDLQQTTVSAPRENSGAEPLPVRVVGDDMTLFQATRLWSALGPVLEPLSAVGLSVVLLIFMLVRREDLRDRVLSVIGRGHLTLTTKALDEAGERISRFLLAQLVVNGTYGLAAAAGLYAIGVPYAALWGLFAAVLRYIPFLGAWLASIFPIALSVLVAESWTMPLLVVGLYMLLETISNMVIEPWLYSRRVGLSETAVLVMVAFWTWLWGPIGLVLATPMTVCLVVLGKYVPGLTVFDTMLGDRPSLGAAEGYYQRLIAQDHDEAADIAESHLAGNSLVVTYDALIVRSLSSARLDVMHGLIDADEHHRLVAATRAIADELQSLDAAVRGTRDAPAEDPAPARSLRVLGLPARDDSDHTALGLLGALLDPRAFTFARAEPGLMVSEMIARVDADDPDVVCVMSVAPGGGAQARLLCLRLEARHPDTSLLACRWGLPGDTSQARVVMTGAGADAFAPTIGDALRELAAMRTLRPQAEPRPLAQARP